MTSTYLATAFGVSLGLGFTALAYTTVPAYTTLSSGPGALLALTS